MNITRYVPKDHYAAIGVWHAVRGQAFQPEEEVPEIGFVAYHEGGLCAVTFLRRVEGGFAEIDGLASNPMAPAHLRNEGLDACIAEVIKEAQRLNIKGILAHTEDENTLKRAIRHGLVQSRQVVLGLALPQRDI